MAKFYITCAIPYVNAAPHIGHALEFIEGDVIARYHRLLGEDVILLSGGDENALKNVQAAEKTGIPIQQFVDTNTKAFFDLTKALHCTFDIWQKGSDVSHHFIASQKLWDLCQTNGDIYKKTYEGLYCVGCELFYSPDELSQNGECFEHPGKKLESVSEENYFFRLSKYQKQLIELIQANIVHIVPEKRKHEVLAFLERGLEDISISRSNERAKNWGVPVPGDHTQRMYVWFDALNIYQSGIGFGWNEQEYEKWWPADVHVIGKGITRFHAIYWPAFLLSAKLKLPKTIFVHEYFTVNGQKMSKTLGNVIDPFILIKKYGADPIRYFFLAKFSPFNDGDFSEDACKETYNADLANGLGNLVARVSKLCEINNFRITGSAKKMSHVNEELSFYNFHGALKIIWDEIKKLDVRINDIHPWTLSIDNEPEKLMDFLLDASVKIVSIAYALRPFLPETSKKIIDQFTNGPIKSQPPLFPRLP